MSTNPADEHISADLPSDSDSDDDEMQAALAAAQQRLRDASKHRQNRHDAATHLQEDADKEDGEIDGLFDISDGHPSALPGASDGEFPGADLHANKGSLLGLSSTGTTPRMGELDDLLASLGGPADATS